MRQQVEQIFLANEREKSKNDRSLRPNLSNPEIRQELDDLDTSDRDRSQQYLASLSGFEQTLSQVLERFAGEFKTKILNNTDILVYVYDNLFIGPDFILLPGDEQAETKRNNIKRLAIRKKMGKAAETVGPRGYKRAWQGLSLFLLCREESTEESQIINTFKMPIHKSLFKCRNETFKVFSENFGTVASETEQRLKGLREQEEVWSEQWEKKIDYLKNKEI